MTPHGHLEAVTALGRRHRDRADTMLVAVMTAPAVRPSQAELGDRISEAGRVHSGSKERILEAALSATPARRRIARPAALIPLIASGAAAVLLVAAGVGMWGSTHRGNAVGNTGRQTAIVPAGPTSSAEPSAAVTSAPASTTSPGATQPAPAAHATPQPTATPAPALRTTDCFSSPGACGYPDPAFGTAGTTTPCASLPTSLSTTISTAGAVVQNLHILGSLEITAANVTVSNVCVTGTGGSGHMAVWLRSGAVNTQLKHSTFGGTSANGTGVVDTGIYGASSTTHADAIVVTNAATSWSGGGVISNSYFQAGATYSGSANQDVYLNDESVTLSHDTLLNSAPQSAVLFGDINNGGHDLPPDNNWNVSNSLLAGGGWIIYGNATTNGGAGTSVLSFQNNRFGRCATTPVKHWYPGAGGYTCGTVDMGGADAHGYWPCGGYFGFTAAMTASSITWTGNVWDDHPSAPVSLQDDSCPY
jgi:hypothetical protein